MPHLDAWTDRRRAIALAESAGNHEGGRELLASAYGTLGAALLFIDWDAGAMKVTNDTAANQYLRRDYRKGWEL